VERKIQKAVRGDGVTQEGPGDCQATMNVKQKPMKEDKKGLEEACSNCEGVGNMVFCYKVTQLNILYLRPWHFMVHFFEMHGFGIEFPSPIEWFGGKCHIWSLNTMTTSYLTLIEFGFEVNF
jgi:hypothetical protein